MTNSNNLWVFAIRSALDSKGQVHTVWTVDNKAGNGEAIYYARLDADRQKWLTPYALARVRPQGYEVDWANIIAYRDELFVIYDDDVTRVMRRSSDGGQRWTEAIRICTLIGENGPPAFVVDNSRVLHLIFGNRIPSPEIHGEWHSMWDGQRWSEPEAIVSGPLSRQFDPNAPQAIVSQGNILLATWKMDPAIPNGIWYSYAILNAPELPITALPTVKVMPLVTPSPTSQLSVPNPTRFPRPAFTPQADGTPPSPSESSPNIGILVAILPVIMLLTALVVVRSLRGRA